MRKGQKHNKETIKRISDKNKKELSQDIVFRIFDLAYRGYSAYTIAAQLKHEGAEINRFKIKRLIENENLKRIENKMEPLVVNKNLKAPFISNIRLET